MQLVVLLLEPDGAFFHLLTHSAEFLDQSFRIAHDSLVGAGSFIAIKHDAFIGHAFAFIAGHGTLKGCHSGN